MAVARHLQTFPGAARLGLIALGLAIAGCATRGPPEPGLEGVIEQPFRDLNLIREEPVRAVRRAAAAPYRLPLDCPLARAEIQNLDHALGADVDANTGAATAEGLAGELLKDVTAIPFRGVVRRLTGAEQAQQARRRAVLGAVARRGFLKGWAAAACAPAPTPLPGPRP